MTIGLLRGCYLLLLYALWESTDSFVDFALVVVTFVIAAEVIRRQPPRHRGDQR